MKRVYQHTLGLALAATVGIAAVPHANAQQRLMYGPGTTMSIPQGSLPKPAAPVYQRAPRPAPVANPDPTQSLMYRALAPLEPYAIRGERFGQGAMRCGIGGASLAPAGPLGAGAGCIAGVLIR